ncbi:nucleotidyltransferase family protein [Bacillus sp. ISL-35]|uniref:nucleotidyltransferase domain-containing protein n=1 Tax=Bacillus sp. ISL-35 TaxID=2819122 RepID=UPI001BE66FEB|nr:nucleotidyltransferase family protein [Bacillus sp. ISL-35]MBT2679839.1 nucleotidyltransferase family protein [Bacillus sp. ISL-35]MBT2704874.1 nucleotidyltransferase family protein [Chryseobacterium sp. ISL-80]
MNKNLNLNLTKVPKELKLILEIVKTENLSNISIELQYGIDWELFVELAIHHRLYPSLYLKLANIDYNWIPGKTVETLHNYYIKNTYKMLQLSGEMEQLSQLLLKNEVRPIFLKGPVLAADLYGDISMRTSGDLDILIPMNDLQRTNDLLESLGYKKDEYIQTVLNDWTWRHHHFTYYNSTKRIKVEIHWRLNPAPNKEPGFSELWNRKRKSNITFYPIYFLGKEDLFYFLVTHGARHGWSRLRWLLDIHQIMKQELDWDSINKLLRKFQATRIGGQSIILSSQLFNTTLNKNKHIFIKGKVPHRLAQEAVFYLENMVNLHTAPVSEHFAKYHSNHLFSLMSLSQKIIFLLSFLHPYYIDAETFPLPKNLHFLYYPLRPILWMWRRKKKQVLS